MPRTDTVANPSAKQISRFLKGRELITIGIFFALYFVLTMIPMVLSGIHPMIWVLFPGLAAIIGSIPYLLLCARVQKPFAVLIMGAVMCALCSMAGYVILALILFLGSAALAEIIRWRTGYASWWGNAASFVVFSFGWTASPLPIWLYHDAFMENISHQGMSPDYVSACAMVADPVFMSLCLGFTVVGAFIGVVITRKLFKKHFEKAGLA